MRHLVAGALWLASSILLAGGQTKAYVTEQRPAGLTPARHLSGDQRRENFEALWTILDANYADFELKTIDWQAVGRRYRSRLESVTSDDEFYLMLFQLVNELKDTHSWLDNYALPPLSTVADLPTDIFQEKPFVVAGRRAGWEVLSVDGMTPAQKTESLRPLLRACSSERAFQREAGRSLLAGKAGEPVRVALRSPGGEIEMVSFTRDRGGGTRPARVVPPGLTRQQFVHFGRLPAGLGYIQIESFNGRQEIAAEFDRALDSLRETPGLVLDIRDNPGGFGQRDIVGRFATRRVVAGFSYRKSGARHRDLAKQDITVQPAGAWQYTRPVALLVNDVTGSAADLFALELRSAARVVTVGTTTHGNLSGVAVYGVLPCGLVVRISNGYITDARNRPIEVNGIVPDVTVAPSIDDYLHARDPVLERAVEVMMKKEGP